MRLGIELRAPPVDILLPALGFNIFPGFFNVFFGADAGRGQLGTLYQRFVYLKEIGDNGDQA